MLQLPVARNPTYGQRVCHRSEDILPDIQPWPGRRWDLVQSIAELTSHGFRSLRCSLATVAGKKSLREEVVVRYLRNLSAGIRANVEAAGSRADKPAAAGKRAKQAYSESEEEVFEEETEEEEEPETVHRPLGGTGDRKPPEPKGPPPAKRPPVPDQSGDVLVVDLGTSSYQAMPRVLGYFLVIEVQLIPGTGTLAVRCKSLGSSDASLNKDLSSRFNRREGWLHFCSSNPCIEEHAGDIHVGDVVWHTLSGAEDQLTPAAVRSARKWLAESEEAPWTEDADPVEPEAGTAPGPARPEEESRASALRRTSKAIEVDASPPTLGGARKGGEEGGLKTDEAKDKTKEKASVRRAPNRAPSGGQKPSSAKQVKGKGVGNGAPSAPALPPDKLQKLREDLQRSKAKLAGGGPPEPPPDNSSADDGEGSESDSNDYSASGSSESVEETALGAGTLMNQPTKVSQRASSQKAISAGTSEGFHEQLIRRAAGNRPQTPSGHHKEDNDKMATRSSDKKRKKEKSGGESIGSATQEEIAQTAWVGSEHAAGAYLRAAATECRGGHAGNAPWRPNFKVMTYLSLIIKPQFPHRPKEMRELHMLASTIDLLRQGQLAKLGDVLAGRLVAIHQSLLDASWVSARHLEVLPMPEGAALGDGVLLAARKHGRQVTKAQDVNAYWPTGKGRGKGSWWKGQEGENDCRQVTRDGYEVQPVSTDAEPPLQRMSVGEKGLEIFAEGLANVSTIAQAGCFAAWLIAHAEGATQSELSIVVRKVVFEHCWKPQIIPKKGMIFPMRAGELEGFVRSLRHCSLEQALDPTFAESWKLQAWQLCARVGLNAVSGSLQPLAEGRLNAIQNRAAASLTKSCGRLLELKGVHPCTADSVEDELKGKRLSYTGEEVSTCHPLTLDQVLPGLPPAGHGGSVDALSLLSSGTSRDRPWWHVYLDNFCAGQKVMAGEHAQAGQALHNCIEDAWAGSGLVSSEKKRVSNASRVQELGAWLDGDNQMISVSGERMLKLRAHARRGIVLRDAIVKPRTLQQDYQFGRKLLPLFRKATTEEDLDNSICNWIEQAWAKGRPLYHISTALCGVQFFCPGIRGKIPESWRLFKVWRRLEVPCRAPPMAQEIVFAIAGLAIHRGDLIFGALILAAFEGLLRTGEMLNLCGSDLLIRNGQGLIRLANTKTSGRKGVTEVVSLQHPWVLLVLQTLLEYLQEKNLKFLTPRNGDEGQLDSRCEPNLSCGVQPDYQVSSAA
ncbi:unnamed protein product [Durusdinium trenchii]|uniref:Tyr recombinase domain-containing protein n=1 Tax=Durusdinium trenchii TaxID=1381693 RepID=A0ABP0PNZ8_9DINO